MHTTEEVEAYVKENEVRLEESLKNCGMISFIPIDVLRPVLQAGAWLGPTLAKDGATDEQISNICLCHGQRSLSRHRSTKSR